jgi:hypothetical protein
VGCDLKKKPLERNSTASVKIGIRLSDTESIMWALVRVPDSAIAASFHERPQINGKRLICHLKKAGDGLIPPRSCGIGINDNQKVVIDNTIHIFSK